MHGLHGVVLEYSISIKKMRVQVFDLARAAPLKIGRLLCGVLQEQHVCDHTYVVFREKVGAKFALV